MEPTSDVPASIPGRATEPMWDPRCSRSVVSRTSSRATASDLVRLLSERSELSAHALASEADRGRCAEIVDSKFFEAVITCTVLCNTLQMGLEADYPGLKDAWDICENVATSVFVCEMLLKIIAKKQKYFHDRSNWLDAVLTILGVIDCWVMALVKGDNTDLQSASILRILRLFRLARASKVARKIKAIVLVFTGLYRALETTIWVLVGLVVIMFVFAIFCTEYIGRPELGVYPGFSTDSEVIDDQEIMTNFNPHLWFGSMHTSMLTLFSIAIGSEWSDIVRPLAIKQPVFVLVFLFYCILIVFGVMNVIIAIVVDNVMEESRKLDKELDDAQKRRKRNLLHRIQHVLNDLDQDGNSTLTYEEIQAGFTQNPEFKALLHECDFPAGWNARELLEMLDFNGDGCLEKDEFTTNVFRLMDSDDFQQVCILQASMNYVKQLLRQSHSKLAHEIRDVKEAVCSLQATKFSVGMSDNVHKGAEEPVRQVSPTNSVCFIELRSNESLAEGLAASSTAERTSQELTLGLSSDKALQQMRDLLERSEVINGTDAKAHEAVEQQQRQLLAQSARKAVSTESMPEKEVSAQDTVAARNVAGCPELEHEIKRLSYKEFADILESAFATMRETLHKEVALPAHVQDNSFVFPRGPLQQASCAQTQAMNNSDQKGSPESHAWNLEPSGLQQFGQMRKLSKGVRGALRCCAAAKSSSALRTGEFVHVRTSL